ncbi:histone-lysine N-methyltransferase SETMAR [Elysia marginata]|uniref:Histone-lysine N-methyltransferase SETMAR n=1 Tax=Elysia marginata TaxID=1093978 RepID=A0AAV4FE88_9GAST|nr:histone-lysine N-methyltransferase SETMAR [Elysia marginata]
MRSPSVVIWFLAEFYPDPELPANDSVLMYALSALSYLFYDYSSFVSVFLAVVRCACVARPLKFKTMFNKKRTFTTLSLLFLVAMTLNSLTLAIVRLGWTVNPWTNSTYRSIKFKENSQTLSKVNDILNRNIIAWLTYITVVTCVVILAAKLQAASRFRRSLASNGEPGKDKPRPHKSSKPSPPLESSAPSEKSSSIMSVKDVRVIQSCTWFGEGRTSLDDESKSRRPKPSTDEENTTRVDELIKCDKSMKIRQIALEHGTLKSTVYAIVHDSLGYRKVSARWVPKMLTEDHKLQRVGIPQRLLLRCQQDNGDEDATHVGVGLGEDFQAKNNLFDKLITCD